jgi:hypothetical protein
MATGDRKEASRRAGRFFLGGALEGAERRWMSLLESYRRPAQQFCRQLIAVIGTGFGLAPPEEAEVGKVLSWLTRLCGGLGPDTEQALEVSDFATVLQVGRSVLSGTAAALAQDPQVQKAYLGTH